MKISMIAAVGKNLELGKDNDLIWHLPNDLKYFKKVTNGKVIVMGKNTFLSLPGVLPNRKNIVLTRSEINSDNIEVYKSIPEFMDKYKDFDDEIFIIGGASIYKQFLDYANKLYLTEIDDVCNSASVFFPEFDKNKFSKEIVDSMSDNGVNYTFVTYRRKNG